MSLLLGRVLTCRSFTIRSRIVVMLLVPVWFAILASGQQLAPEAPLLTQLAAAKSVFISFGGADASLFPGIYSGSPARVYSEFYLAMQAWGRYALVLEPASSDLILEIRLIEPPVGSSHNRLPVFQVVIIDPKTRAVLWVFNEYLKQEIAFKKHRDRLFTESMGVVIDDLKALVERKP